MTLLLASPWPWENRLKQALYITLSLGDLCYVNGFVWPQTNFCQCQPVWYKTSLLRNKGRRDTSNECFVYIFFISFLSWFIMLGKRMSAITFHGTFLSSRLSINNSVIDGICICFNVDKSIAFAVFILVTVDCVLTSNRFFQNWSICF